MKSQGSTSRAGTKQPINNGVADVPAEDIWFDGVDKKILEAHTTKTSLVEGNDQTLMTRTPLEPFSTYAIKKRSKEMSGDEVQRSNGNKKKEKQVRKKDIMKPNTGITDELALDCEMVECYHHKSVLARVSIVNLFGHPILDRYVAPPAKVTNYRTQYSGIRRKDLENAPEFQEVQSEVAELIKGRIVVGHAVHNDFDVLKINHPRDKIRDTQRYFKYLFQGKTPSLKKLSESLLGVKIQKGEHDSVQDAQATMKLYVKERDKWNEKLHKMNTNHIKKKKESTKPKKKKLKTFYVMTN